MIVHVFTGPTISVEKARSELDAVYHPPVSEGDILRLMARQPNMVGIIDGYFERVPAVWHKEILYAISQGVPVFGSASMGALRAAELSPFGMIGIGAIFEAYRDGRLEDDDEVAVIHGPEELGFPVLSEAMVNVRRNLADAMSNRVISEETGTRAEMVAKSLHYSDRSYAEILKRCRYEGLPEDELRAFQAWLPSGRTDQKEADAREMLRAMKGHLERGRAFETPPFHFEHTILWDQAVRSANSGK